MFRRIDTINKILFPETYLSSKKFNTAKTKQNIKEAGLIIAIHPALNSKIIYTRLPIK